MPLSVKDGMGAWIKDFQKSDAPQFKGKSDKERRDMAIAAYMDAKKESVEENVSAPQTAAHRRAMMGVRHSDLQKKKDKPPFTPDPPKPAAKNSDNTVTSPMSRAKQLAKMARDRAMKKEEVEENYNWKVSHAGRDVHVKAPHAGAAVKKAQKGFGNIDLTRAKVSNLGKVGTPVRESIELDEMFASTVDKHKDGYRPKVVKDGSKMHYLGSQVYKSKEHARNAADHIANAYRKGRASDSYIQDFARRHHKEHGMKESFELDEAMTTAIEFPNYFDLSKAEQDKIVRMTKKYNVETPIEKRGRRNVIIADGPKSEMQKLERDLKRAGVKFVATESVEYIEEANAYANAGRALADYARKQGGMDKADFNKASKFMYQIGKADILSKGQHLAAFSKFFRDLDTDVRDGIVQILKKQNVMESIEQLDELSPATHKSYQAKAYSDAAKGMAKKRMGTMSSKDAYDNEVKRYKGIDTSKYLNRKHHGVKEENLDELKKSTLGNYVKVAAKDAASKAYGAASAAKDNRPDQAGKDFSKSMKRLRGIDTATKKLAKESVEEAKSFDQKFKDHLKFATSKSPAVQNYLAKRKADRDAMNKANDPNAAKKGYALTAVPPERAFKKARKKGMSASDASQAVGTASRNRGRKLPK